MNGDRDKVVTLDDYRRKKYEQEVEYLREQLAKVLALIADDPECPPSEAYYLMDELTYREPYVFSQGNYDSWYTDEDEYTFSHW